MLMESHILGKGCKTHGAGGLIPCLLMSKASAAGYFMYVVSKGWLVPRPRAGGVSRLLKWKHATPPKSSDTTSVYSFPASLMRKCVPPNSAIVRRSSFETALLCTILYTVLCQSECVSTSQSQGLRETPEPLMTPFPAERIQSSTAGPACSGSHSLSLVQSEMFWSAFQPCWPSFTLQNSSCPFLPQGLGMCCILSLESFGIPFNQVILTHHTYLSLSDTLKRGISSPPTASSGQISLLRAPKETCSFPLDNFSPFVVICSFL